MGRPYFIAAPKRATLIARTTDKEQRQRTKTKIRIKISRRARPLQRRRLLRRLPALRVRPTVARLRPRRMLRKRRRRRRPRRHLRRFLRLLRQTSSNRQIRIGLVCDAAMPDSSARRDVYPTFDALAVATPGAAAAGTAKPDAKAAKDSAAASPQDSSSFLRFPMRAGPIRVPTPMM